MPSVQHPLVTLPRLLLHHHHDLTLHILVDLLVAVSPARANREASELPQSGVTVRQSLASWATGYETQMMCTGWQPARTFFGAGQTKHYFPFLAQLPSQTTCRVATRVQSPPPHTVLNGSWRPARGGGRGHKDVMACMQAGEAAQRLVKDSPLREEVTPMVVHHAAARLQDILQRITHLLMRQDV